MHGSGPATQPSTENGATFLASTLLTASSNCERRSARDACLSQGKNSTSVQKRAELWATEKSVGSDGSPWKRGTSFSAARRRSGALSPCRSAFSAAASSPWLVYPP